MLPALTQAAGGSIAIAFIGSGTPDVAAEFAAGFVADFLASISTRTRGAVSVAWYTDPFGHAYRALGLHRGVVRTFTWRRPLTNLMGLLAWPWTVCKRGWCCREVSKRRHFGDQWQQGGAAVVAPGGGGGDDDAARLVLLVREESPGWPPLAGTKLAAAVREASTAPGLARQ